MKYAVRCAAALWIAAVLFIGSASAAAPAVSAQSAVLLDRTTGRVLWAQNSDKRALIASTTKILTGLLVCELCSLDAPVEIPPEAVDVEGSSLDLQAGDVYQVRTLLYGMMLHSGNDAATVLAVYCAGSVENFAVLMNQRAQQLGLFDTHFVNPHGLDDSEHYSTAADLAHLAAAAMEDPVFREVVSTKAIALEGRQFTNHNKLLWQYPGALGVKTGYTRAAGRILVSCAQQQGRELVAVTIDDPNDWADHAALLDYGFSTFTAERIASAGAVLGRVPVLSGTESYAMVAAAEDVIFPVASEERWTATVDLPRFVYAPVREGNPAGVLRIYVDGAQTLSVPLYWCHTVLEEE